MEFLSSARALLSLYVLSGLALGIGFVFPVLWWVSIVGIVGFIGLSSRASNSIVAALGGFLAWTSKSLLALLWFFTLEPFAWLSSDHVVPSLATIAVFWLYVGMLLGVGGAVVSLAVQQLSRRLPQWSLFGILPLVWVVGEVLGSFVFSLGTYGEGAVAGASFSFGYVGYHVALHEVMGIATHLGGVYALTFLSVLVGYGVWSAGLRRSLVEKIAILAGVVFLVLVTAQVPYLDRWSGSEENVAVAVVETNFSALMMRTEDWAEYRVGALTEAVQAALALDPDYIVLPEDARLTPPGGSAAIRYEQFSMMYADPQTIVVDSRIEKIHSGESVLRAYVLDGRTKQGFAVDKQILVPVGEYVPYVTKLATQLVDPALTESFAKALVYRPGPLTTQQSFGEAVPAILFCFESVDPLSVWRLVHERDIPFVVHPISHAMFSHPTQLWWQLDRMLSVQARFNRVPIVSAGNKAPSALYLPDGTREESGVVAEGISWQVKLFRW